MRRLLGRTALALLALLLLLGAALVWLLATPSGLRAVIALGEKLSGGALAVEQADGRLLGSLQLEGLRYQADGLDLWVSALTLDWQPRALLNRELHVVALRIGDTALSLPPPAADETADESPGTPPDLQLPLALVIDDLRLGAVQVSDAQGQPLLVLDRGELRGAWRGRKLRIDHLDVQHPDWGAFSLHAEADSAPGQIKVQTLTLEGAGTLHLSGTVALGAGANDLDLNWRDLHWPPDASAEQPALIASPEGQLHIAGPWDDVTLNGAFGLGPVARVKVEAARSIEALSATLAWTDLADLQDPANSPWQSPRGTLTVRGAPEDYRFELSAELRAQEQAGTLKAQGRGDLQTAVLESLRLRALGGAIDGRGRIAWAPAVDGELHLRAERLDPSVLLAGWPGAINGAINTVFSVGEQGPDARFDIDLRDSKLRNYPLALQTQGRYRDAVLRLATVDLRSGRTRISASGRATPPLDLRAQIDSPNLDALWPGLRGSAELEAQISGALNLPRIVAQGKADDLAYKTLRLGSLHVDADIQPDGPVRAELKLAALDAGTQIDRAEIKLGGRVDAHSLHVEAEGALGAVAMDLQGAYAPQQQRWRGSLDAARLALRDLAPWTLEDAAAIDLSPKKIDVAPSCFASDQGRACARLKTAANDGEAAFRLHRLQLKALAPFLPPEWRFEGELTGTGFAQIKDGAIGEARAEVALGAGSIKSNAKGPALEFLPSTLVVEDRGERIDVALDFNLNEGGFALQAQLQSGAAPEQTPISGRLDIRIPDLAFVSLLSPEISEAQGQVSGQFALGGTLTRPKFDGAIDIADGRFRLETPGIVLTPLSARISGPGDGTLNVQAGARSGDGEVQIDGRINLAQRPLVAELTLRGENFQAANTPEARIWINPDLKLTLDDTGIDLSGELLVPRADITPKRFQGSGVSPSPDQLIVEAGDDEAAPEPGLPLRARVKLALGDQVRFEGFGLKTRLEGAITAIEKPGTLTAARGELRLIDGSYEAYGQELEIQSGRLIYSGGPVIDPALELRAVRRPRENILVGVRVRGTLDKPEFKLFSEPSMPQDAQLSWLVLGRPLQETGSGGDSAALANAALSLGLKGGEWLAQQLGGSLGLDEISVGAKPGENADQAQVTIGKYLSPKLYVSYGVSLFQPGHSFRLRYDLGRGFAVQTETGVHSGGDLLYSIER